MLVQAAHELRSNHFMQHDSIKDAAVARHEKAALVVLALAAVATVLWLVQPVGVGVLLGVLLAFTFRPAYVRIVRRRSSSTAALAVVLGATLAIALTFAGLVWVLVRDGTILVRSAVESLQSGGGAQKIILAVGSLADRFGISSTELDAKIGTLAKGAAVAMVGIAQQLISGAASMVLALFFLMLTMHFLLRQWESASRILRETVPLRPDYTLKLLEEFRRVGRATLMSTVVIGLLQGALATVGYAIVGLPQPLFFGVLTAIASLAPGVGTMLVWAPTAVALILLERVTGGVFLLAWGVVVLTVIPTYIISPRLIGSGGSAVPALFTFIALFGGTAVLGLKGLIIGPVLMAIAIATLRLYASEEHPASRPVTATS